MSGPKPKGLARWLTTVDHRDIGVLYLVFAAVTGLWGGLDAMFVRTALLTPKSNIVGPETYNAFFTTHGITMLFLFATPVFFGFANYVVPLLIGADDLAFPRLNAVAFWLLVPATVLVRGGTLLGLLGAGLQPPTAGWTLYVPLSSEMANPSMDLLLLGLHLAGIGTILSALNLVVTIVTERDVGWDELDIFTWSILVAGGLVLFAFPVLGSALVMLLADRNLGTAFFTQEPLLWQHLFWFFGHPEVYIITIPAMGVVSHVLPRFADRRLFGFSAVVYSTLAIGVISFGVWAHHMFATGMDPTVKAAFMAVTLAIAVPSAVKTFNWLATLWRGRIRLDTPMLFCLAGVATFVVGGITGVFLGAIPVDIVYHGTYYVVAHFHFMLVGLVAFGAFAGCYFWYPLVTGRMYDPFLARVHFWSSIVGLLVAFLPMFALGMAGLPRRMAAYPVEFATLQRLSTVGAYLIGLGQLVWAANMTYSARSGPPVSGDVWDLGHLRTRCWETEEPDD